MDQLPPTRNRIFFLTLYFMMAGSVMGLTAWLLLQYIECNVSAETLTNSSLQPMGDELLIIDTDAGNDDAVAILAVLGDTEWSRKITAITCVNGNTAVDHVTKNVLKILKIANRLEVPVYRGASQGIIHETNSSDFFGIDGMGDANYPEAPPDSLLQQEHAAVFLADAVRLNPGSIAILMIGPMTNVALAVRLNPQFMVQVGRIISLGGAIAGGTKLDIKPAIEFNVYKDVESASVVLQEVSRANRQSDFFTMLPIEPVESKLIETSWRKNKLGVMTSDEVDFLNRIEKNFLSDEYWTTFDIYAAAILLRPDIVTSFVEVFVDVELQGQLTRGRLVVDYYAITKQPPNVRLITGVNQTVVQLLLLSNLNK